ncbi:coagulation factor XI-like [Mixophyes fleayi]|uniref:coagulation factor XI-like n=1 Tax=Mixophyes fleayi TaxID=3061075 RepID=UPI003F4D8C9F
MASWAQHRTGCLSEYYNGVEFVGNVLSFGFVGSREECEASCTRNPGCQFYTYYPSSPQTDPGMQQRCYLQYSTSLPSPTNITATEGAQSGMSQRDCCTGSQCLNGCADFIFQDTLFVGTIITSVKTYDPTICQQQCNQNPLCQFFSYSLHENLWCECYLKRSASGLPDNITSVATMFSGFAKQATEPGFLGCADLVLPDSEYAGITVLDVEVQSVEQCQQMCTSDGLCQFFTMLPGDTNTANGMSICRFKNAPGNIPTMMTYLENAVSGFSMQYNTVQKTLQNCSDLLYPDIEFSGVDVVQVLAVDADRCRISCTQNLDCKYFTFLWDETQNSFICKMRTSFLGIPDNIFLLPNATSGFSLNAESYLDCSALLLPHTTFSGSLIGYMMAPDVDQCQRLCTQNPPCQFFTYLSADWTLDERRFYCFLQSGNDGIPGSVIHLPNTTSGFTKPLSGLQFECITEEYNNLNFPGSDERSLKTDSYEECRSICTKDPLCQFFTFFSQTNILSDQTDTCYLKSLLSVPLPQIIKYSPEVVSGFPQRNCKGHTSDSPTDTLPSC